MDTGISEDLSSHATLDFNIRNCEKHEALEMLQDKSVSTALGFETVDIENMDYFYILDESALLFIKPRPNNRLEVHIACPRRNRAGIRDSFLAGIKNILQTTKYKQIYTTAPDERIALTNMLKSLGFTKTDKEWVI